MRGSREISLVPSLHRASTDALIGDCCGEYIVEENIQVNKVVFMLTTI